MVTFILYCLVGLSIFICLVNIVIKDLEDKFDEDYELTRWAANDLYQNYFYYIFIMAFFWPLVLVGVMLVMLGVVDSD